jgi:ABC-2 type transport system ATP-binding protein
MVEVERLCDRVVFLSAGRVVADGRADEIAQQFGRDDLEGVFLHLAAVRDAGGLARSAGSSRSEVAS